MIKETLSHILSTSEFEEMCDFPMVYELLFKNYIISITGRMHLLLRC